MLNLHESAGFNKQNLHESAGLKTMTDLMLMNFKNSTEKPGVYRAFLLEEDAYFIVTDGQC